MRFSIFQDSRVGARPYQQDRIGRWQTRDALLMLVWPTAWAGICAATWPRRRRRSTGRAFQREAKPRLADPQAFLLRSCRRCAPG